MSDTLLELKGLSAGYGDQSILRSLDLAVAAGSVTGIVGPNGHGKTTLLRAISGMASVFAGSIRFLGRDVTRLAPYRRARAGLVHVPQGDRLFLDMSVEENLLMGAYRGAEPAEVRRRLAEVEALLPRLAERRRQVARTLSGGERRMVGLGRGLMADGRLLMIDEPSLGLAPVIIEQVYGFLRRLKEGGRSILLVEESPARLAGLADAVALIDNGTIVWRGTGDDLQASDRILETYLGG